MSKFKSFLQHYKTPEFPDGGSVHLYKNEYRVISSNDNYTLLKDLNNTPFAIPTAKLREFLKKSLNKANGGGGAAGGSGAGGSSGGTPSAGTTTVIGLGTSGPTSEMKQPKVSLPTCIKNGRLQRNCPTIKRSYWMDMKSGDTYDNHDSETPHGILSHLTHEKDLHALSKMKSTISNSYDEKHHGELNSKLDNWAKAKMAHKQLTGAYKELKNQKEFDSNFVKNIFDKEQEVGKHFKELQSSLKKYKKSY